MSRAPSRTPAADRTPPRLRRAYYDCRYGQLHLHNAIPAGGGFDELTALIGLHGAGETGRVFASLLPVLGVDRSVYALDLPGCGETDPSPGVEPLAASVLATGDFVDSMRIRQFDLIGRAEGCTIARRLAEQRPTAVRRLVLIGDADPRLPAGRPVLALTAAEAAAEGFEARVLTFLSPGT